MGRGYPKSNRSRDSSPSRGDPVKFIQLKARSYDETHSRDVGNSDDFHWDHHSLGPNPHRTERNGNYSTWALRINCHGETRRPSESPRPQRSRTTTETAPGVTERAQTATTRGGAGGARHWLPTWMKRRSSRITKSTSTARRSNTPSPSPKCPSKTTAAKPKPTSVYFAYTLDHAEPTKAAADVRLQRRTGLRLDLGSHGRDGTAQSAPDRQRRHAAATVWLIDNPNTWLDQTDLVFIDPVGTGYSRAKTAEVARRMNGVRGDIQSVGEFVRMYLTRNNRWMSPLFIAGESYGTFRAAGLAGSLVNDGVAVNGVTLISTILNYGTGRGNLINNTPYALIIPTLTADAWYHKRLDPELAAAILKPR